MKKKLLLSYLAQLYSMGIGIILMPVYLKYLGPEGFGLLGIFMVLQALVLLLDFGFSPTVTREISRYQGGELRQIDLAQSLSSLKFSIFLVAAMAAVSLLILSEYFVDIWLNFKYLSHETVYNCFVIMCFASLLKLVSGFYRCGLIGLEMQNWVNGTTAFFATLKFVFVLPLLLYGWSLPVAFFLYQFIVNGLELLILKKKFNKALSGNFTHSGFNIKVFKQLIPFSASLGFFSITGFLMMQIDKIILTKILDLESYGYFTLAAIVSGGIVGLISPVSQILQPRMAILKANNQIDMLVRTYRNSSQLGAIFFTVVGGGIAVFSEQLLFSWTGDLKTAQMVGPILFWYALAAAMIGILTFPFVLQYAFGYMRLHVVGVILQVVFLLPVIMYAASFYGAKGVGMALFFSRVLFFICWIPWVHRKILPELFIRWHLIDIFPMVLISSILLSIGWAIFPSGYSRFATLVFVIVCIGLVFLITYSVQRLLNRVKWLANAYGK